MSPVEVRDLGEPEAVVTYPLGASFQVRLAGTVVTRHVLQPGWSWEAHAQPEVGREVETAGDSFLIVFDGAEPAIRCGLELIDALAAIGGLCPA